MNSSIDTVQPDFDDEFLIRVFVRLRRQDSNSSSSATTSPLEHNITTKVMQATRYALPSRTRHSHTESKVRLKRTLSDLIAADETLTRSYNDAGEAMRVRVRVVEPTVISYCDAATGSPITYEEYESRYYGYLESIKRRKSISAPDCLDCSQTQGMRVQAAA
jgi:hypothetical protein